MKQMERPPRTFAVNRSGCAAELSMRDWQRLIGMSDDLIFASDILLDAHMLDEDRLRLLQVCEMDGRSPVDFARHLVKLNRALRDMDR